MPFKFSAVLCLVLSRNKIMVQALQKLFGKAGLNSTIAYTILVRIVYSLSGVVTLFLITYFLNKNEQGYFYTFLSILSIRLFFELGLTSVLTQYAAHEFAHLRWKSKYELTGEEHYESRLASIVQLTLKWSFYTSAILFIVLFTVGNFFFSNYNQALNVQWQVPWLILSIATSAMLLLDLFFALMEGLGKIEQITQLRLIQQLINLFLIAVFLLSGFKLFANALALLLSAIVIMIISIIQGYFKILKNLYQTNITSQVSFRKEILPFQFRLAVGNISSYFIFQLFNPVLFATQGPVIAGQMGATQTFLGGITAISSSWISTKIPLFSSLVAKRKFKLLNLLFKKNVFISCVVCLMGLIVFNVGLIFLENYYAGLRYRFLGGTPVLLLSLTQLAGVIGSAQGYYLRSFKKDPFFISAVVIGVLTGVSTIVSSKYFGIVGITLGCLLINGIIGLTWGSIIFARKKTEYSK
jgi:O-antigen/teichoic acid export membrane protein